MELKYLRTFRTINEEGSFSRAAARLNYTQSTITFQMQQLEQELSLQLFEKIGRRMVLTKAGENLIPYVDEVLQSVEKMKNVGAELFDLKEELRVGVAETQLCYCIPEILQKFQRRAPGARLMLRSMNCYAIRDALIEGSVDLGIFYRNVGGCEPALTLHEMRECPVTLVASPTVKARFPDFITPDRRLNVSFIINEPECIFRQIFEEYLREKRIVLDRVTELWSIPTIKNLVINDMGISYLPSFTVEEELRDGRLCSVETELDGRTITAVCGHHKNKWVSPLMELFIRLVTGQEE